LIRLEQQVELRKVPETNAASPPVKKSFDENEQQPNKSDDSFSIEEGGSSLNHNSLRESNGLDQKPQVINSEDKKQEEDKE